LEADVAGRAILLGRREAEAPAMTWDDTLGNMAALDRWRAEIRVQYPMETKEHHQPVHGRPLRKPEAGPMRYGEIPGLHKPVSKLIMGCDNQETFAHGAAMWDDWYERGGNAFDTAHIYGGGVPERLLGQWIASRGVRDDVVIVSKGAHTPHCTPEGVTAHMAESLERMGLDYVDVYILHRDNPDVPVSEFIDVMNEHVQAGRVGVFGGSNWTIHRFDEANQYAKASGRQPMSVLNNNLSLAHMINPVWPGCIAASDGESLRYLTETQTAHLAWSSQARGYFLPPELRERLGPDAYFDSEDNRERRRRAESLAAKQGVSPLNIAAAYVLSLPFPSFALVGPRSIEETATAIPALAVELSDEEVAWLDLRD